MWLDVLLEKKRYFCAVMSRLVIHIGPPKCGSSTIQNFCLKKPFKGKVAYRFIPPDLYLAEIESARFEHFIRKLKSDLKRNDAVIISHESLFMQRVFLKTVCERVTPGQVSIIGYARKPSSFLVSSYNQWFFRDIKAQQKHSETLEKYLVNPIFFSGLEIYLMGLIFSDFKPSGNNTYPLYNWNYNYQALRNELPADSQFLVNSLPSSSYSYNLIDDFCEKAGLVVKSRKRNKARKRVNTRFDALLVESISNSLYSNAEIVPVHSENKYLIRFSQQLGNRKEPASRFVNDLCACIDSVFLPDNKTFCSVYSLPLSEFEPRKLISKEQLTDIIKKEFEHRKTHPEEFILHYRKIIGECAGFAYQAIKKQPQPLKVFFADLETYVRQKIFKY